MHIKYILLNLLFLAGCVLFAQPPVPGAPQERPIAIVGATAHLGNGEVIENALITFADGRLTRVEAARDGVDMAGFEVIDAAGKHVYPGFIAANSQLGLIEIAAVSATRDSRETGYLNPNARALIAYSTDSQVTPTVRSRGVLYTQVTPQGGLLAGQSSIVHLDAWNWEDAAVVEDDGHHLSWPRRRYYNWREGSWSKNEDYPEEVRSIKAFLRQARAHCLSEDSAPNLRLGAACRLFTGEQLLYVHVDQVKDIEEAVVLGKELDINVVIVGGAESYLVTDLLKEYDVPVVLGSTHALPSTLDSDVDQPFKTPAALHEAGVRFCLSHEGFWQQRNLPFQAGTAVAYGLPYEKAVQALTLDAASILGIADRVGSLEVGKAASLFISTGDALDMRSSVVEQAYIDGRRVDLDNKQEVLYRRFQEKYKRQ